MLKACLNAICACLKSIFCCCIKKTRPVNTNLITHQTDASPHCNSDKSLASGDLSSGSSHEDSESVNLSIATTSSATLPREYPNGYWEVLSDDPNNNQDSDDCRDQIDIHQTTEDFANTTEMATGDLDQFVTLSNISMIECDDQYIIELDHLILEELRKLPTYPTEDDWNSFYNSIKTFCTNALGLETRTFQTFVNYFRPRSSSEKNINLHLLTFIAQTLLQFTTANPREQERYDEWLISRTGNQRSLSRSVKNKLEQVVTDLNVENLYKQLLRKRTTAITLSVNNGKDDSASYSPEDIQILKQKIMTMIEIQMSAYMKECEEEAGQGMEQYKEYRLPCLFIGDGKDLARISYTFQSDDGTERNHPNNKRWNKLSFEEKQEFAVSEIARLVNGNERAMQHICRYANQNMTIGIQNGLAVGLLQSSFGEGTLISGSAGSSITIAKDTESNNIILTYRLYRRPAILWNNLFGEALFISEQRDREKWENTSLIDLTFSIILDPYANYDPTQIRCVDLQSTIFLP